MKKITMRRVTCASLFTLLLVPGFLISVQAQSLFIAERVILESEPLDQYFTDYELVSLPVAEIHEEAQRKPELFRTDWLFPNGMQWQLTLESSRLMSSSVELAILETKEARRRLPNRGTTHSFRSIGTDQDVRLSIRANYIYGYVFHEGEEWYIEPVRRFLPGVSANVFIVYASSAVIPMPGLRCGQTEKEQVSRSLTNSSTRSGCREVELAIATDFSMYEHYGSAEGVLEHVEGVLNNVSGNFDDEFEEQIQFRMTELVISACADCDPWFTGQEAVTLLHSFGDWGQAGGFVNDFDIGQFWSRRNYQSQGSGGIIGMAHVGAACAGNAYQILEDFIASAGLLRVMSAHEFGHSFGCVHNYNSGDYECYANARPDFIMDPGVSLSDQWTSGSWGNCDANSVGRVNTFFSENTCMLGCDTDCGTVSGLVADFDQSLPALSLNWQGANAGGWAVLLEEVGTGITDTFYTLSPEMILNTEIELCSKYEVTVAAVCNEIWSVRQSLLLNTAEQSRLELKAARPKRCDVSTGTYELALTVSYATTHPEGFTVWVAGEAFPQAYEQSPQEVHLVGLDLPVDGEVPIYVRPNIPGTTPCGEGLMLSTPDQACDLVAVEHFDDCRLPLGWHCSTTYPSGANWQIGDSTRYTVNFGASQNTIDGSCMLYFDDDVLGPYADQSGRSFVTSPMYDLEAYEQVELSLMYNLNAFFTGTNTSFTIEVFDGENWILILKDQMGQGCSPSQAWSTECFIDWSADLSLYANAQFCLRFGYDDGGQWAEFVAIDNVRLEAQRNAGVLPVDWGAFTAKAEEDVVRIEWTTLQEQNNTGFYVERSTDGRTFSDLQFVASSGDSDQIQAYFHLDTRPLPGRSYYRLRQLDVDGTASYSTIREVTFRPKVPDWGIYPNPVGADGQVFMYGIPAGDHFKKVDLLSIQGQLLQQFEVPEEGAQPLVFDLPVDRMPTGIYLLRAPNGAVRRLIVN